MESFDKRSFAYCFASGKFIELNLQLLMQILQ